MFLKEIEIVTNKKLFYNLTDKQANALIHKITL